MNHKNIAKWNLVVASLIAISSIFFESIRVFALIVFLSALGIYVYHAFIKKDNNIALNQNRAFTTLLLGLIISMVLVTITYFIAPENIFLIISGIILSISGIVTLLLLTRIRSNKDN